MRLLLVEDDPNLLASLATQLEHAGYVVDRAADGEEGLFRAREYPVDLAIIDLGLPKLSGVEVIKGLRAAGKAYPVLVELFAWSPEEFTTRLRGSAIHRIGHAVVGKEDESLFLVKGVPGIVDQMPLLTI